jgi:hypothetical protein
VAFIQAMSAYALTPLARADIFDIWCYIVINRLPYLVGGFLAVVGGGSDCLSGSHVSN